MSLTWEWIDRNREPQCTPNPDFPNGMDVDVSAGAAKTCTIEVPYPAMRCGLYVVTCEKCRQRYAFTTAGRPDDPRKFTLPCLVILPGDAQMKRTPHP